MNKIVLLALTALTLSACKPKTADVAGDSYQISGSLTGLANDTILLIHRTEDATIIDTAVAKGGSFSFTGKLAEPQTYLLQWMREGKRQRKEFFVENVAISISGHVDSADQIRISGSNTQKKYDEFLALVKPLDLQMDSLDKVAGKLEEKDKAQMAAIDTAYNLLEGQKKNVAAKFVSENATSLVAPFIVLRTFAVEPVTGLLDTIFKSLDDNAQKGFYGKQLSSLIASLKQTEIGALAPAFSLNDTSGKTVSLESYKGKVVLVDFWASWCVPCRHENPNVVKAYRQYHPKGLEILGISLDEKRDKWITAISKDTLTWQHVSDLKGWNNVVAKQYAVRSIPNNYLIDKDGKIIAKGLHGEELQKKLAEVLK